MKKPFSYSVLKFRPSYLLQEQINIGLLFVFPIEKQAVFVHPHQLSRITQFYKEADLPILKIYLKAFEEKAKQWSNSSQELASIHQNLLPKDANNLYLTNQKSGVYTSITDIINYYENIYFSTFYSNKKDLKGLNKKISEGLKSIGKSKQQWLKKDISISNIITATHFEYVWQNGSTNLVKIIGLNLKTEEEISNKAIRWWGELTQLKKSIDHQNLKIDILVSKPQLPQLFEVYHKAINLLDSIEIKHTIIEEEQTSSYIQNVIDTIEPLSKDDFFSTKETRVDL